MSTSSGPSAENLPRARTIVGWIVKWGDVYLTSVGLESGELMGYFGDNAAEAFTFFSPRKARLACGGINGDDQEPARVVRLVRRGPAR